MRLEEFVEIAGPLRALGVKVSQDGEQIAEHLCEPVCRRNIYSATKSFTSAAVGIAIGEGLLSLDERGHPEPSDGLRRKVADQSAADRCGALDLHAH